MCIQGACACNELHLALPNLKPYEGGLNFFARRWHESDDLVEMRGAKKWSLFVGTDTSMGNKHVDSSSQTLLVFADLIFLRIDGFQTSSTVLGVGKWNLLFSLSHLLSLAERTHVCMHKRRHTSNSTPPFFPPSLGICKQICLISYVVIILCRISYV